MSNNGISFVLRRILKLEPKKRKRVYAYCEEELLLAINYSGLDFADTLNNALYYFLHDIKQLNPEEIAERLEKQEPLLATTS